MDLPRPDSPTESDMARTEARRYQSFKLADELRQTSDDLTRMARLFVVTADDRYKHYFDEILAIREESAPDHSTTAISTGICRRHRQVAATRRGAGRAGAPHARGSIH